MLPQVRIAFCSLFVLSFVAHSFPGLLLDIDELFQVLKDHAKGINLSVAAYPNPTTNHLILRIEEFDISNLSYQQYDMNGKLWQNEKIMGNQTSIVMSQLVPANYVIKVLQENMEVKTFKIIKN